MNFAESVLERTLVYRAWQAPFAAQKFAPILAHNPLTRVRRVLDVACGPGTNTKYFAAADYLGIDINERYIRDARKRHSRYFIAADVRNYIAGPYDGFAKDRPDKDRFDNDRSDNDRFDFVLVNSFLHHLNAEEVLSILAHLKSLLTADGRIHILELVLPGSASIARLLARWDRGKFARPLEEWQQIFEQLFEPIVFEPYNVTGAGITLWNMVYFQGRSK